MKQSKLTDDHIDLTWLTETKRRALSCKVIYNITKSMTARVHNMLYIKIGKNQCIVYISYQMHSMSCK